MNDIEELKLKAAEAGRGFVAMRQFRDKPDIFNGLFASQQGVVGEILGCDPNRFCIPSKPLAISIQEQVRSACAEFGLLKGG